MFVLLNGAFGIGKTTTAKAIVEQAVDTSIYDPEPLGVVLQRLSAYVCRGGRVADFQDLWSWRRLTAFGARMRHRHVGTVIVPMAFTNLDYLEQLASTLGKSGAVHRLCLVAPLPVIRERLMRRARIEGTPVDDWALHRAEECCRVHLNAAFGYPIDATRSTQEIVRAVRAFC